jgi:peptidoglycan/xylan/chitin deacetylase (PgdA/CDA1 family)
VEKASQLLVLNYHHVDESLDTAFSVKPSMFMDQLELLLNLGFLPLSINELIGLTSNSPSDKKFFLVTFDDGYDDFLTHALPVLEDFKIPVSLFIIGDYIGRWNDWDPLRKSRHRHLTLDELRDLESRGVEFGGHSCTHPMLTSVKGRKLESEIIGSKTILESALNTQIKAFAYPGGHFNRRVVRLTARTYALGFAAMSKGPVKQFHPFRIHRFDPFLCKNLGDFQRALFRSLVPLSPAVSTFWERVNHLFALSKNRNGKTTDLRI